MEMMPWQCSVGNRIHLAATLRFPVDRWEKPAGFSVIK